LSHGFEPWLDTREIAGGHVWTNEIEVGIDESDAVLALLTPFSFASRICRAEQLRALRKKRMVIPLLAQTESDIPLHLEPDNYRDFSSSTDYERQFQILLEDLSKGRGGARLKQEYRSTYVTAPPLLNFVPRPEEQESLKQFVMTDTDGIGVALTALKGMGGLGKTMLAQSLCHDEGIQQAFPDGVLWITAGQEPVHSIRDRINEVRRALNDQPALTESELTCINRYRGLLHDKAVLLVVDDIEPFLAESARSCVLFTTRDASIAASLGARECRAGLLSPEKSRELLAHYSDRSLRDMPPESNSLLQHCGGLPLALAMIGAMLRGKPLAYWSRVLTLLENADLAKIRAQFPNYPHASLLKCIQVSVDVLDVEQRERYLALAALLEDMAAVPVIQQALWNADPGDAMDTAEHFIELSLAQREGEGIRLHDLQLDYVRAQYSDRAALDLIHGAIRLSAHVITHDPDQFASQMTGRLLPHNEFPAVALFTAKAAQRASMTWLRPLHTTLHPSGASLIRTLQDHEGRVNAVALSADGRRAVSASQDATLRVWDVDSGRIIHTLEGHSRPVNGLTLSADGRRAVSASQDGTLKVWDVESGRVVYTMEGHSDSVLCVALSTDGQRAVSASGDLKLRVWDVESGHVIKVLEGNSLLINGLLLSADGRRVISASGDQTLKVWDVESGRVIHTLKGHSDSVSAVALSADGRRAVSASKDQTLKVWDVESGRLVHTLEGHSYSVYGVALSADGRRAVSASEDQTLKVWDVESSRVVHILTGHSDGVSGTAFSANGRRAVSASYDRTLMVWDVDSGSVIQTLECHSGPVSGVALNAGGERAIAGSSDHRLMVWDVDNGCVIHTQDGHSDVIYDVALSADGQRAVTASADHTLKVWELKNGRVLHTLNGHRESVISVALSADGRRVVSASGDQTLKVWDVESGRVIHTMEGHSNSVFGVALSADGRRAVSASGDQTLKVWEVENGRVVHSLKGHSRSINGVSLSADGRRAVTASSDQTVKVWDVEAGKPIATFTCDDPVLSCAIMADRIVAGDAGGGVHFLRVEECRSTR